MQAINTLRINETITFFDARSADCARSAQPARSAADITLMYHKKYRFYNFLHNFILLRIKNGVKRCKIATLWYIWVDMGFYDFCDLW